MRKRLALLLLFPILGCGSEPETAQVNEEAITVESWKALDVDVKYEPEIFDRLKLNEPRLSNERNWDRFMRDVIVPERRKDIPTEY